MVTAGIPSRREFLKYSVASIAYGSLALMANPTGAAAKSSFNNYMSFSEELTGMSDLDNAIGQIFYEALTKTSDFLQKYDQMPKGLDRKTPEEIALEEEILLQWYTGIYGRRGDQRVATYDGALMWQAMKLDGAPGYCRGEFGDWSRPPEK